MLRLEQAELCYSFQEIPPSELPLTKFVSFLNTHWRELGLSHDWYNLTAKKGNQVGFLMERQLDTLTDETVPLELRIVRTKQDIIGYCLEYLSSNIVFPVFYKEQEVDGTRRLQETLYQKFITDLVDPNEREGAVKESLADGEKYLLDRKTADGSLVVIVSPPGDTGLITDKNEAIIYENAFLFLFQKKDGGSVDACGLCTDMTVDECSELIRRYNGVLLSSSDDGKEYVKQIIKIPAKEQKRMTFHDIADSIREVRTNITGNSDYAHRKKGACGILWGEVHEDLDRLEEIEERLFTQNEQIKPLFAQLQETILNLNFYQPDARQKLRELIAATLLRLGEIFLDEEEINSSVIFDGKRASWQDLQYSVPIWQSEDSTLNQRREYGWVLQKMADQPGCAGGGSRESALEGPSIVTYSLESRMPQVGKVLAGTEGNLSGQKKCAKCGVNAAVECGVCRSCMH